MRHGAWVEWFNLFDPLCLSGICGGVEVPDSQFPIHVIAQMCKSEEERQAVAASAQDEFTKFVQPRVAQYLLDLKGQSVNVEGIVLVGGCALNVVTNQAIRETLTSFTSEMPDSTKPKDVYVPPAPNDSGLAIGAIWSLYPPTVRQPLQYLGFRLFDAEILEDEARKRGARKLSDLGGVEYLAELLAGGPAWQKEPRSKTPKPVIAVVRGRQEFGPRALGHRSLLAFPDSEEMRDRMNRIKFRQWYRPAAPMIADEALEYVFGHKFGSVYMEFAPLVREEVRQRFPGLSHFDGTARHQSVGKEDEPWVHALLLAVGKWTGLAALINTSFNSKGKPITNTVTRQQFFHSCVSKALFQLVFSLWCILLFHFPFGIFSLCHRPVAASSVSQFCAKVGQVLHSFSA